MPRSPLLALVLAMLVGCDDAAPDDAGALDASAATDAGAAMDAGVAMDAATPETDASVDASTPPLDAGADDAGLDAGAPDAGSAPLVTTTGCFTVVAAGDKMRVDFGEVGTAYSAIDIEVDLVVGAWREDVFDRPTLNHNTFGVYRNAPVSRERYLGGLGVQISPPAPLRPTTLFFGRVDLDPRPAGMGYMGYTTFRETAAWANDTRYHVAMTFDAAAHRQVLDVTRAGMPFSHVEGDIAYFDSSLTDDGWYLELGSDETDGRDVSPVGWQLCDLVVRGR
ncbi:MAG: hypothetical protein H6719_35485 [Sandaracinaceae bacterium]|nr:hypothetical protein [Sandaracinaceae bacterium]